MHTLGCNTATKTKQEKTKPIKPNNPHISIQYIYIYIYIYILLPRKHIIFQSVLDPD